MSDSAKRYFGKYRGTVLNNRDPERRGRLIVAVQDIYKKGQDPPWALPCLPYVGKDVGLYLVPPEGAWVWVEFEQGCPDDPIWSGGFWALDECPARDKGKEQAPALKLLKTAQASIAIDDSAGSITITLFDPEMVIVVDKQKIELRDKQGACVQLAGQTVTVNEGALEVQ